MSVVARHEWPVSRARATVAILVVAAMHTSTLGCGAPREADTASRDAVGERDARSDAAGLDAAGDSIEPFVCDRRFTVRPTPSYAAAPILVDFTDSAGYTSIALRPSGPGMPTVEYLGVRGTAPFVWSFRVGGLAAGVLDFAFMADPGAATVIATCRLAILPGAPPDGGTSSDAGIDADARCVPRCVGVPCGGDDGCGNRCAGTYRDRHGAVSDCRVPGDCGCGIEPNDNMVCGDDGMCVIRCSCDCLPPQRRMPSAVAGLDHAGACRLVFRESHDPTVWDEVGNRPLCPLDHDPVGTARCVECPPCHRDHPPSCPWNSWCECRDTRWVTEYRTMCCAAGSTFCF